MTNIDRVSAALGEWGFNIAKAVLPQINIPVGGKLAGLMQIMGADPATYSIWNELGFLAEPIVQTVVTPAVHKMLGGIPDEQVPELANKFIDSFIARAEEKGSVNLFGLELGKTSFERLREIVNNKMES
jgi:hypothetical protein